MRRRGLVWNCICTYEPAWIAAMCASVVWFGTVYITETVWIAALCASVVWFGTVYVPEPVWIAATEFSVYVLLEFPHVKNPRIGLHILK